MLSNSFCGPIQTINQLMRLAIREEGLHGVEHKCEVYFKSTLYSLQLLILSLHHCILQFAG